MMAVSSNSTPLPDIKHRDVFKIASDLEGVACMLDGLVKAIEELSENVGAPMRRLAAIYTITTPIRLELDTLESRISELYVLGRGDIEDAA